MSAVVEAARATVVTTALQMTVPIPEQRDTGLSSAISTFFFSRGLVPCLPFCSPARDRKPFSRHGREILRGSMPHPMPIPSALFLDRLEIQRLCKTMTASAAPRDQGVAPCPLAVLSVLPAQRLSSQQVTITDNTASGPAPCRLLPAALPPNADARLRWTAG
jgi:hypothetical protein